MQVVYGRCAGLDVHKQTVVACVLSSTPTGKPAQEVRTFGTMTRDLQALAAWLREQSCSISACLMQTAPEVRRRY